ncbi:MAG: type II 3-dehydroquinate dehydratase [Bacteroidales bacterium]
MKIHIINGPNLNLLGEREKEIYGEMGMNEYLKILREHFEGFHIDYFQSNIEGELVDTIQEAAKLSDGIVLNAGGYTHTSVAIRDAVASISCPVVEVHVSNIFNRESFRQTSLIAPKCKGSIAGFGLDGYRLAIESLRFIHSKKS